MSQFHVGIAGVSGKTGSAVTRALLRRDDIAVVGGVSRSWAGQDLGRALGQADADVPVWASVRELLAEEEPEVLVDFTTGEVGGKHAALALESRVCPVVGTTGIPENDMRRVQELVEQTGQGAVFVSNFSLGILLLTEFALRAARIYDSVEIIEKHHDTKKDAPSGTALRLAHRLADEGYDDPEKAIPIHSVRLPGLVAHHEVMFGGTGERLTLLHDTSNRESFAPGVVLAIKQVQTLDRIVFDLGELL